MNLGNYIQETSTLLGDSNNLFTSQSNLIIYINDARREVAIRTACMEAKVTGQSAFGTSAQPGYIIPGAAIPGALPGSLPNNTNEPGAISTTSNGFTTIPGLELYSYEYAKGFLQQQYTGYKSVVFVRNVACSWGGDKPTLDWVPWDDLQAYYRSYNIGVTSYPYVWSQSSIGENGQVYLFPVPSNLSPGTMEWECVCTPLELYTNTDYDALPEVYQNAVKYWAAYRAYLAKQRSAAAASMRAIFDEMIGSDAVATDWGHSTSHYKG